MTEAADLSTTPGVDIAPPADLLAQGCVTTGERRGKAGSCAIQRVDGGLVASIEGSHTNVMGLPAARLIGGLRSRMVRLAKGVSR